MQALASATGGKAPGNAVFRLGLFKQLVQEIRSEERSQKTVVAGNVGRMLDDFRAVAEKKFFTTSEIYFAAKKAARQEYSSADINQFIFMATEIQTQYKQSEMIGVFASAFANHNSEKKITLHVHGAKLSALGFVNTKIMLVYGGEHEKFGMRGRSGRILLDGDSGNNTAFYLEWAVVFVNGSTGKNTVYGMTSGRLIVAKDVEEIGLFRKGTLEVHGEIKQMNSVYDKVYLKGSRVGLDIDGIVECNDDGTPFGMEDIDWDAIPDSS